ncbi:putative capsular polysaccharide bisynthesis glycosyl transferase [Desulforapulum autotrophicum HRM2]|uniref:Capsular polysaccharide bisynthesis glycosyl transferase n=1 Tax=Desulforapulum autotrophicum (strain ATCC 43914 / DSM 3382 / VKM B-1955 / HRM2) TaxID=177437 RepID=C0QGY3_DESAH|nr:glycosyltransferase family 4 protein [Desulforapulum autotrophicum]ACN15632.1 putative capsular polysaccharide bisynthesis glycosyl transferase [Desulforapulum autotrophicum HRM2]
MKIFVTGTRGIPDIPGGVEKHCQELYPIITQMGHEVFVATRKPYVKKKSLSWKSIKLIHTFAPRQKSLEAIVHTFLAVVKAWQMNVDVLHIHAVGPGLMVPFAKLLGLKVVITNHGPDYDRKKWGKAAKVMLRFGEYLGGKFADEIIVISSVIQNIIKQRCKRSSSVIYNGVPFPALSRETGFINRIGVEPGRYIIAVARFVPEKGLDLLINAFQPLSKNYKLVIAGDADHETEYSRTLKQMIDKDDNIIRTGYITGEPLNQLFSHAGLFVLPSFHEGLPISLLEAMSYGLSVLVSDIPANLEVDLEENRFFKTGDLNDLKEKLSYHLCHEISDQEKGYFRKQIQEKYNWKKIAEQTIGCYAKALS